MKIEYFPGANNEAGIATVKMNRREMAFMKAGMALLYIESCKARKILPRPLIETYADAIKEIFSIENYGPDIFADMISHLESDGKAWYTYLENKFTLDPMPSSIDI